jgi:adenylyltransferase/sulfurtransferase
LCAARVCVVGAGGLGAPALLYLAAAGVGTIGIADDDVVEMSNLQRQVVHGSGDLGREKAFSAADSVRDMAPWATVEVHNERLTATNALRILGAYDLVLDGTDNFDTRYLVADTCTQLGVPLVWASILRFDAQLSVFWARPPAGSGVPGVQLRDLFPSPPSEGSVESCSSAGVLGAMCGQVGSTMAAEAVKLITGAGEPLLGRVLILDALAARWSEVPLRPVVTADAPMRSVSPPATAMGTGSPFPTGRARVPEISPAQLRARLKSRTDGRDAFVVIDVREPSERSRGGIPGSVGIPLSEVLTEQVRNRLPVRTPVVVYCQQSGRAWRAADELIAAAYADVTVLGGGYDAWLRDGSDGDG